MSRVIKILLIFEIGLVAGIFLIAPRITRKTLSISSHLADLSFNVENTSPTLTLIFTGDVMLGRSVNTRIQKFHDYSWPFQKIFQTLRQADLTIINLESPFVNQCQSTDSGMLFCADQQSVQGLILSGVDIATLANNHINNYGSSGVKDTIDTLASNNIAPIEAEKTYFNTVKNNKIALLAFSDLPQINNDIVKEKVNEAAEQSDITIVSFHWGNEYQNTPSPRQTELAHLVIDSGADLVIGHHPHVIQTEEMYKNKYIFYSLGNLVFDQMWSEDTRIGNILRVDFVDGNLIKKELIPIKIYNYGQPELLSE